MADPKDYPPAGPGWRRFWCRFYSGGYEDEGCRTPKFPVWLSGQTMDRRDPEYAWPPGFDDIVRSVLASHDDDLYEELQEHARDDGIWCALIDARDERHARFQIESHYPDVFEISFIDEVAPDWVPNDRFR